SQQSLTLSLPPVPGFPASLPAMQLTVPAFEVHVDTQTGTYQLVLDPTLTIPGFSQSLSIPALTVSTDGNFTQTLNTTSLNLGNVLRIDGALVFERVGGVFQLEVRNLDDVPQLTIADQFTLSLEQFVVRSDGTFDVDATVPRLGPD